MDSTIHRHVAVAAKSASTLSVAPLDCRRRCMDTKFEKLHSNDSRRRRNSCAVGSHDWLHLHGPLTCGCQFVSRQVPSGSSQEVLHFLLLGQRHVEIDCRTEEDGNALEAFASGVAFADSVRPGNASTSNADPTRAI
jgi:hypothetical protein